MLPSLTSPPAPTEAQLAKIEALEREAADARRRSQESFDRCDTDGFLSQWANDMTASLNRRKVEILRNGGYASFPVLVHIASGRVIADTTCTFSVKDMPWVHNTKWRVENEFLDLTGGKRWIPFGSRSRIQKQLGLRQEYRWFPAYASIGVPEGQRSTGLSGCANARVMVYRGREDR